MTYEEAQKLFEAGLSSHYLNPVIKSLGWKFEAEKRTYRRECIVELEIRHDAGSRGLGYLETLGVVKLVENVLGEGRAKFEFKDNKIVLR